VQPLPESMELERGRNKEWREKEAKRGEMTRV